MKLLNIVSVAVLLNAFNLFSQPHFTEQFIHHVDLSRDIFLKWLMASASTKVSAQCTKLENVANPYIGLYKKLDTTYLVGKWHTTEIFFTGRALMGCVWYLKDRAYLMDGYRLMCKLRNPRLQAEIGAGVSFSIFEYSKIPNFTFTLKKDFNRFLVVVDVVVDSQALGERNFSSEFHRIEAKVGYKREVKCFSPYIRIFFSPKSVGIGITAND
jgi:hypothetical protein